MAYFNNNILIYLFKLKNGKEMLEIVQDGKILLK